MTDNASHKDVSEEPQSARGAPGSRDTGSDEPGGGPADRPAGSFDDKETISGSEADAATAPAEPTPAEPVIPPYDERKDSADD